MAFSNALPRASANTRGARSRGVRLTVRQPSLASFSGRQPTLCMAEASESTSVETSASTPDAAAAPETVTTPAPKADAGPWIPVMAPEALPKGVRKEVNVSGTSVLLFWYRSQIYAIASRSPAEGAYSQGFIKAKFTQDYGIICPSTGSVFSLKDGSITEWYPTNPVLRSITPQSDTLPIYPVKLTQDAIMIDLSSGAGNTLAPTRGGSDTSLENNNVFALQPAVYVQGSDADEAGGQGLSTALTFTVALACFGIIATAGTATALYYEDFLLLGAFWAFMLGVGGVFAFQYFQGQKEETPQ